MLPHRRKITLVFLALLLVSRASIGCPEGKGWKDFSSITFATGNASLLTIARFADGHYARIEDEKSVKEMYQLANNIYLFKGHDPSTDKGPSPFFMLDIPVGIVLKFLSGYIPQPCAAPNTSSPFSYSSTSDKTKFRVSGNAHFATPSVLVFDLIAVEHQQGVNIKASGTITFLDIAPVSLDTDISEWIVTRGFTAPSETIGTVPTIRDLGTLIQSKPKQ